MEGMNGTTFLQCPQADSACVRFFPQDVPISITVPSNILHNIPRADVRSITVKMGQKMRLPIIYFLCCVMRALRERTSKNGAVSCLRTRFLKGEKKRKWGEQGKQHGSMDVTVFVRCRSIPGSRAMFVLTTKTSRIVSA